MARPIHADAQATRGRILASAAALFSDKGLAETTMREIARMADVSMATVHHYYGRKAELYRACIDAMHAERDRLRIELEREFFATRDSDPTLARFAEVAVRRSYAFARKHRRSVQLMMRTIIDTGELTTEDQQRYLLPFLESGARELAPLLGKDPVTVRVAMLSLNHLIVRFALSSPRELALIVDDPGATDDEAIRRIEDYLVLIAQDQLAIRGDAS